MKARSKSSLFLMELIVVILFFSLASTVCIQLFVKSHLLGKETKELNNSVLQAQNLAETFLGFGGDINSFTLHFPNGIVSPNSLGEIDFYLMYDKTFQETSDRNACIYYSFVRFEEWNNIITANIKICSLPSDGDMTDIDTSKILYSLSVDKYAPERSFTNE